MALENLTEYDFNNSPLGAGDSKILCVGEALIDMICTDKGKTLSAGQNFLKKPGGAPTNVAAAIAALGGKVELAAKVGNDPFGKQLIEVMQSFGVSTKWMLQTNDHFTTFAFVSLMEDGERDFVFNRGADGELSRAEIEEIILDEFSIIHFGSATGFLPGKAPWWKRAGPMTIAELRAFERSMVPYLLIARFPTTLLSMASGPSLVAR